MIFESADHERGPEFSMLQVFGKRFFQSSSFAIGVMIILSLSLSKLVNATNLLHPGDRISVVVFNHPDLSTVAQIAGDGTVSIPILGPTVISGLTPEGISHRLDLSFSRYIKYPAVEVRVLEQGQTVFVTGATYGTLVYQPGETLVAAIAGSGQQKSASVDLNNQLPIPTEYGDSIDLRNVGLKRDGKVLGHFNVEDLSRHGQPGPLLEPGDDVMVSNKPIRVIIRGDVRKSGPQYLYPGDSLAQALDQAGGLNATASTSDIKLTRSGEDQKISSASPVMRGAAIEGDSLDVAPAPLVNVLGMVEHPGLATLKGDTTLLTALYQAGGPNRYANLKQIEVVHNGVKSTFDVSQLAHGDLSGNTQLADGDEVFVPEGHRIDITPFLNALSNVSPRI